MTETGTASRLGLEGSVSAVALAGGLAIAAFLVGSTGQAVALESRFTSSPPTIDGTIGATEWAAGAGAFALPHGTIYFESDASNLYVLYDMTGDPILDSSPTDYFYIGFDVNLNGAGDPGIDFEYSTCDGEHAIRPFLYDAASCSWGGCEATATAAVFARGWGPSPASAGAHVILELSIPFSEIQGRAGEMLRVFLAYGSPTPSFVDATPASDCSYAEYLPLHLAVRTAQLRRHLKARWLLRQRWRRARRRQGSPLCHDRVTGVNRPAARSSPGA